MERRQIMKLEREWDDMNQEFVLVHVLNGLLPFRFNKNPFSTFWTNAADRRSQQVTPGRVGEDLQNIESS